MKSLFFDAVKKQKNRVQKVQIDWRGRFILFH